MLRDERKEADDEDQTKKMVGRPPKQQKKVEESLRSLFE